MEHRRRVLFFPSFFLAESWNGMDEHLLLLTKYLDRERYELMVLTHAHDGPQTRVLSERAGIRAVSAPDVTDTRGVGRLGALRRLFAAEQLDVLHVHSPVAGGHALPILAAKMAGVPATLVSYHQIQPQRLARKSRAINHLLHRLIVNCTIAVSGDVKRTLTSAAGVPADCIRVVHNGIDLLPSIEARTELPRRGADEVRIGYFGRLSPEKGLPVLLEAIARLVLRHPRFQTFIVGDGPDRAGLEDMAARLGITDCLHFLGFRADARRIMDQIDIVVHVPVYEGFGLVVLEAMAAGRPVVVNNAAGGIPEIVVDGETGVVVPCGSPEALSEAIARLAARPDERIRLGANGQLRCAQHFSAQLMAERTASLYEACLSHLRRN
jgi:glycosyltransferase involved in cell wall biosynthesis